MFVGEQTAARLRAKGGNSMDRLDGGARSASRQVQAAVAVVTVLLSSLLFFSTAGSAGALGPNAIRSGFDTTTFGPNDDGSYSCTSANPGTPDPTTCTPSTIALPHPINFFGTTYSNLFLNNNGNLTFDTAL